MSLLVSGCMRGAHSSPLWIDQITKVMERKGGELGLDKKEVDEIRDGARELLRASQLAASTNGGGGRDDIGAGSPNFGLNNGRAATTATLNNFANGGATRGGPLHSQTTDSFWGGVVN